MKEFKEWLKNDELYEFIFEGKDIKKILRSLERRGFRIEYGDGSLAKIYPPDKSMPFYSAHINDEAIHPLRRFAKKNWDIEDIRREKDPVVGTVGIKLPKAI